MAERNPWPWWFGALVLFTALRAAGLRDLDGPVLGAVILLAFLTGRYEGRRRGWVWHDDRQQPKRPRHARHATGAVTSRGDLPIMSTVQPNPPGFIEAQGVGATVAFDGATVTITREGFAGAMTGGRGEKRIPVGRITAVNFKPATALTNGRLNVDGESVVFRKAHQAAFQALHAAVEGAIPQRETPDLVVAKGLNGATVTFDGQTVTINRAGFAATMIGPGSGEKRIPLDAISAIQLKTTGISHYIQFSFSGESAQSSRSRDDRRKDENTIEFHAGQRPAFEALRDAIEAARAVPTPPPSMVVQAAALTVAERIQQLAGLRDQGLISEAEFEAKRTELLAQL